MVTDLDGRCHRSHELEGRITGVTNCLVLLVRDDHVMIPSFLRCSRFAQLEVRGDRVVASLFVAGRGGRLLLLRC